MLIFFLISLFLFGFSLFFLFLLIFVHNLIIIDAFKDVFLYCVDHELLEVVFEFLLFSLLLFFLLLLESSFFLDLLDVLLIFLFEVLDSFGHLGLFSARRN